MSPARGRVCRVAKTYMTWAATAVACAMVLGVLWPEPAGSDAERAALREGRTIITYWDRAQGHEYEMHRDLIEEFNASQGEIYVRSISIGWRIEKLLTAISGGAPPDVCSLEGLNLALLGTHGCFQPLEDWMAGQQGLAQDDFLPHAWDMVAFNGHVYGIPTTTDCYALLWNKAAFRRAGLDPEHPPKTLRELEEYAQKLTVVSSGGRVEQIGYLPWLPWDFTYMWGSFFGGEWFDKERTRVIAADDPRIIASYAWQGSWVKGVQPGPVAPYALDRAVAQAFYQGFQAGGAYFSATNPFYTGKVAMITEGEWQCTFVPKYAPDLDWGAAPIPQPEGAPPRAYSPSIVLDAIPVGSRNVDEALTFLKWYYSDRPDGRPSPSSDYAHRIHNIPARIADANQDRFTSDPKFKVFVNELMTKEAVYFPPVPVGRFLADKVQSARENVIFGLKTPEQAVRDFQKMTNDEWARIEELASRGTS